MGLHPPKVGVHTTYYSLSSFNGQSGRNVSRVLPIINVDSGLTFERRARLFGGEYLQNA